MTSNFYRALAALGLAAAAVASNAQGWTACDTPDNPRSTDFGTTWGAGFRTPENNLMRCVVGLSGTVTHGGTTTDPCWGTAFVGEVPGGLAFSSGSQGSIQSDFDDNMSFVYGAQLEPARPWCFVTINVDGTRTSFGSGGIGGFFVGASGRYCSMDAAVNGMLVNLRVDVIADATRLQWTVSNPTTAQHAIGLWFGGWVGMLSETTGESVGAAGNPSGGAGHPYVIMPGRRPLATQKRITRGVDSNFPPYANIYFDQARPFGFRLENEPTRATSDATGLNSDASYVDEIAFADPGGLIGGYGGDQTFADQVNSDAPWGSGAIGGTTAFLQKFRSKTVLGNQKVQFVHYFRQVWGNSNYSEPYAVAADAPTLIQSDSSQPTGLASDGAMTIGVNVDNSGRPGFTEADKPFPIQSVRVSIDFPVAPNASEVEDPSILVQEYGRKPSFPNGLSLASGETAVKNLPGSPALASLEMKSLTFNVQADGIHSGDLPYVITVQPSVGPIKKIYGLVTVAATPRIKLVSSPAANLITAPWQFNDSSWEAVLGLPSSQFAAFDWDASQNGYVVSNSAQRGIGTWIVYYGNDSSYNDGSAFYQSNPQTPTDTTSGAPQVRLHSGWNLIGNPYNYSFPLSQIVGVSDANNTQALSWQELVNAGIVANFLASWDTNSASYQYIQDVNDTLQPNLGYWVYVNTTQDLTIQWPPIFAPGLGGSTGPAKRTSNGSVLWKLQLAARSNGLMDTNNFVGGASTANTASSMSFRKPPVSPATDVSIGVVRSNALYARSYVVGSSPTDFKVLVSSKKGGTIIVNWPGTEKLPSGFAATLTDPLTHTTVDMRRSTSMTIQLSRGGGSRTLNLHVVPSATGGNLLSGLGKSGSASATVFSYKLSTTAVTSAKITTLTGTDVVALTSDRPEGAGVRTVTWNGRNGSGQTVGTGQYLLVVSATSNAGVIDTKQLQFSR